jgi:predicted nucleic acid-binding protein
MLIADTGFWIALANRKDKHHRLARTYVTQLREPLVTTWPVVTETCYLLLTQLGVQAQVAFLRTYTAGAFQIYDLVEKQAPRLASLMEKYADLPMDMADASLVLLAEHLGHGRILSTDQRDFGTYRWKQHEPFDNLLLFRQ